MADPYATKSPDLSGRPAGPAPWRELIAGRKGAIVGADGGLDPDAAFLVVDCRGIGTLAPFSRVGAGLATLLWLEHSPGSRTADGGNELLARLRGCGGQLYAIKQGSVGGPSDRQGCFAIGADLIGAVLEAAVAGTIAWETDPDFGYDVPAGVPGIEGDAARALLPRLLYSDNDRAYEHADLVAAKKRERAAIASGLDGLDPAVLAASGWPPVPTPADWRD